MNRSCKMAEPIKRIGLSYNEKMFGRNNHSIIQVKQPEGKGSYCY